jgi:hypothetical protein
MNRSSGVLFIAIFFLSCNFSSKEKKSLQVNNVYADEVNANAIDTLRGKLQDGDLIFRRGADAISDLFSNCNLKDKSFSHCGIYLIKHNTAYVYHAIGGTYNPGGALRRDALTNFIEPDSNSGFGAYRLDRLKTNIAALHQVVDSLYALPIRFDAAFDLNSDSLQYCAEFVFKAIEKACNDSIFKATNIAQMQIMCLDNIFLTDGASQVYKFNYKR